MIVLHLMQRVVLKHRTGHIIHLEGLADSGLDRVELLKVACPRSSSFQTILKTVLDISEGFKGFPICMNQKTGSRRPHGGYTFKAERSLVRLNFCLGRY